MTHDEIIEMAQECALIGMRPHLDGIYSEALVTFAKMVAEKALKDHAMQEVQRLGQEIEQAPVAFASHGVINWIADKQFQHEADLYTTPPQRTEQNFCIRCGKRTKDIHTCTPPQENT